MIPENMLPTAGETVGGGRKWGASVSGAYNSHYTPTFANGQTLRTFAELLHGWGANVTAIRDGSKMPAHPWKLWQAARQTAGEVRALPWRSAAAVGVIDGAGGWRDFDFDDCPTFAPVAVVLAELGLPADYPWTIRTGGGWRVSVLCHDDLPAAILTAKDGPGGGPGVFTFAPKQAGDFDHLELRWRDCQTILHGAHPSGRAYVFAHGAPTSPPAAVPLGRVLKAVLAVGELPQHETKPTAAPSTRQVATPAAQPAEPGRLASYAAAALSRELDTLAHAQPGGRNVALNRAAFALGQLVGAGLLARFDVETRLETVALALGLDAGEVAATIKSGLDAGEAQPRQVPDLPAHPRRTAEPGAPPPLEIPAIWRVKHADMATCPHCGRLWHGATKTGRTTTARLTCGNRHKCKGALKQLARAQWGRLFTWESCNVAFLDKGKEYRKWQETDGATVGDYTGLAVGDLVLVVTDGGYGQPTPASEAVEMLTMAFEKLPKRARVRNKKGMGPRSRAKDRPMSPELRALCWTLPDTDTDLLAEAYTEADIPFERDGDYIGSLDVLAPDQIKALAFCLATKAAARGSRWRPDDKSKARIGTFLLSKCDVPIPGGWGDDLPHTEGEARLYAVRERVDVQPTHPLRR